MTSPVGAITTALDKYYPRVLSASIDFGAPDYVSNVVAVRIGNKLEKWFPLWGERAHS